MCQRNTPDGTVPHLKLRTKELHRSEPESGIFLPFSRYDSSSVLTEYAECSRGGEFTQTSTTEFSISSPNSFSRVENNDEKQPPSATALLARTLQSCSEPNVCRKRILHATANLAEPVAGVNNSVRQSTAHGNKVFRCRPRVRYCYERSVVTEIGVDEKRNSRWDSVELK
ncbi:hypothetical protein B0H17DRAFT_1151723 [Mycena rosella]|uniref:Uncharacterized protein n=1 Tax=Mycena rosella TaxID=1033263 RepID=A0AAD7FFV5_MYCRO|nr:hypothetical protein B0H17DRAFT_1151723 [Mycena rosella]